MNSVLCVVKCLLLGAAMARTAKHNPRAASKKQQQQPISTYFASTSPAAPPAALGRAGASSKKEEKFGLPGGSIPTGSYKRKQGEGWYQKRVDGTDVVIPYRYVMAHSGQEGTTTPDFYVGELAARAWSWPLERRVGRQSVELAARA